MKEGVAKLDTNPIGVTTPINWKKGAAIPAATIGYGPISLFSIHSLASSSLPASAPRTPSSPWCRL